MRGMRSSSRGSALKPASRENFVLRAIFGPAASPTATLKPPSKNSPKPSPTPTLSLLELEVRRYRKQCTVGVHTPGSLYECQNKGVAKFAIRKSLILKRGNRVNR